MEPCLLTLHAIALHLKFASCSKWKLFYCFTFTLNSVINRKHFWTGIECKAGSIETLQMHRKSVILDKLRTYKSLIFVPRISVRNSHQSYIHQSAGLTRVWIQSETYTDVHVGRGGDWEKWSFISVPGNHICGACVRVYTMIIESQLTTLLHSNSLSSLFHHDVVLWRTRGSWPA